MRWSGETIDAYIDRMYSWHTIFAVLPHQTISGEWVWLERVNRRQGTFILEGRIFWEYAALGDKLPSEHSDSVGKPPSTGSIVRPKWSL